MDVLVLFFMGLVENGSADLSTCFLYHINSSYKYLK